MRLTIVLAALVIGAPLCACLNDRDSRARSQQRHDERNTNPDEGFPDIRDVVTGRFDRFPSAFYQRRIELSQERIAANPGDFEAYDDMAVAYDRIGDDDKAVEVIERKRAALDARKKTTPSDEWKEHDYAYFANLGTFVAHRWFKQGAKTERIDEMKRGRDLIARAIAIKPDAHFGREKYQLMAMDWILSGPRFDGEELPSLLNLPAAIIRNGKPWGDQTGKNAREVAIGLAGLIVLGAAWESIDVTYSLATMLWVQGEEDDACLAILRCAELAGMGRKSIAAGAPTGAALEKLLMAALPVEGVRGKLASEFKDARVRADDWVKRRNEYLLAKMAAGLHPDTDKNFWLEFYGGGGWVPNVLTNPFTMPALALPMVVLLGGLGLYWLQQRRKRRAAPPPPPKKRVPLSYLPD
ncbi:hypothetical protein PLCT2_02626 [Planctomycetaceae bacterium]|nr:hypothetical protein PLCT2_02626 [Planctomycetaceae bacterium]